MVVPSKLGMRIGVVLALGALGCAGDVKPGLPPDAGEDLFAPDDASATATPREAGTGTGGLDAGREAGRDASTTVPEPDDDVDDTKDAGSTPPRDSGTTDPGTPNPGTGGGGSSKFFGNSRCSDDFLLCEDFESEAAGSKPDQGVWDVIEAGATATIDTSQHARGSKSVHITAPNKAFVRLKNTKIFPVANNTLYGRMFAWFKQLPTPADAGSGYIPNMTFAGASEADDSMEVRFGASYEGGKDLFHIGSVGGTTGKWDWAQRSTDANGQVPTARWVCLEWLFKGDSSETRVWIDGTEHSSLHLTSSKFDAPFPSFKMAWVGWWLYDNTAGVPAESGPFETWLDEVAFDDQRIGCER